jgi:hypothetical protein
MTYSQRYRILDRLIPIFFHKLQISLFLLLAIPNFSSAEISSPQAPSCQGEVIDRGKRLFFGQTLPGIKVWWLDLDKSDTSENPIYQYTFKDSRNCWIVVEGINFDVTTFLDLFDRYPEISDGNRDGPYQQNSLKSLRALWRQTIRDRCGIVDLEGSYSRIESECAGRGHTKNWKKGHLITIRYGLEGKNTRISIYTQHKKIWGLSMVDIPSYRPGKEPLPNVYIYDVDLMDVAQ